MWMKIEVVTLGLAILILASGCMGKKRAVRIVKESPILSSELCYELYPVRETYIVGDSVFRTDTVVQIVKGDTIKVIDTLKITNYYNHTDTIVKTITRNVLRIDTIVKRDSAMIKFLQEQLNVKQEEVIDLLKDNVDHRKRMDWMNKVLIGIISIIIVYLVLRYVKVL